MLHTKHERNFRNNHFSTKKVLQNCCFRTFENCNNKFPPISLVSAKTVPNVAGSAKFCRYRSLRKIILRNLLLLKISMKSISQNKNQVPLYAGVIQSPFTLFHVFLSSPHRRNGKRLWKRTRPWTHDIEVLGQLYLLQIMTPNIFINMRTPILCKYSSDLIYASCKVVKNYMVMLRFESGPWG